MYKKLGKALICVFLVAILCCTVACQTLEGVSGTVESQSQQGKLEVLKTDKKLTQQQVASQIKAQYLLQNNGYKDSDKLVVILTLKDAALIDDYNQDYYKYNQSVGDYAQSPQGVEKLRVLGERQNELVESLQKQGLIQSVEHTYRTVLNGIAVTVKYGDINKLEKHPQVKDVIFADTYNLPQTTDEASDASVIENLVDVYDTGIFNSQVVNEMGYDGKNTAVAILDSGFDCSHSVFANQPQGELLLTQDKVSAMISAVDEKGVAVSNAARTTPGLKLSDVYYSDKIPFVYDYADKDPDVFPYDSEHGTHVAGIIGGKDSEITGVAVNTQLVLMKVFPDLREGASTEDILAALEDAVLLKVDVINMSLGTSCGFVREEDGNKINEVYDKIYECGISLMTAASNSYSSGYGGEQGNTNFVTNPDSGTVGSPSTYAAALSVASISGTKSRYITASDLNGKDSYTFFFLESNAINGTPYSFFDDMGITEGTEKTFEYVTVPGVGLRANYTSINVKGKIALVRRGENTFEEKARIAKSQGAVACIIYNNVDGDIYMSMGKNEDGIPTVSISKDDGTVLAQRKQGLMTLKYSNKAGPFMSDFSSWGPTPSLELKPDITAHGGNIRSAVPGGGYDELSGTSMATPNLCGIVVLIRQYLKEKFPDMSMKEVAVMANELLMSTATIVLNKEGNPYSPRKQGAGLASLKNAVVTKAYVTVDGKDRSKLELFDDPQRTGVYKMTFNVVNFSDDVVNYTLDLVGMTESVSTSDSKHVSEKARLLEGGFSAKVDGVATNYVTVAANSQVKVELEYTLTTADKNLIDSCFPYGMYVEGFVKLGSRDTDGIDLNVPFLAFYGDWTEAPLFDKTFYEVESEAHNQAIDAEDKIKADYYATTPYGSYWYNYIIPLGAYIYDIDTSIYDEIPASQDHIAISNVLGTIDGISAVYAGLLRNAKTMLFTITDKVSGEVVYEHLDYNANKAYSNGGTPVPYYEYLKIHSYALGLVNNRQYEFKMQGLLDYGDGGADTNVRNSFSFDFYMDDEAPVIKDVSYEKTYDRSLKKDRYYITLTVYDNQYVQSVSPLIFSGSVNDLEYSLLTKNPIPVYGERGKNATVRFEITDYLEDIWEDDLITSALAFSIDDYALNSNIFICQLPGTRGDFKFTKDGTMKGSEAIILNVNQDEIVDLTRYLATADATVDSDRDYLKYLNWSTSDSKLAVVKEGQVHCLAPGRVTITVTEEMNTKRANIILNIRETAGSVSDNVVTNDVENATIESLRFSYFDTLFAYSRSAQTSAIGETGERKFLSSMPVISFYPGEKIKLHHDFNPWYAEENYTFEYSNTNDTVAKVTEDGEVTALKKGTSTITLRAVDKRTGRVSNIMAVVTLDVKSEFVIENRTLIAYKGLGGRVEIPDDEGILYIGAYAFCLYDTDHTIELTEEDYDANKIPSTNTSVTSVVIPYGVEEIQKYAFYNCSGLRSVEIPSTCKFIREYAFYNDQKLKDIKLTGSNDEDNIGLEGTKVQVVGREAFANCVALQNINLTKVIAIGVRAFDGCTALEAADLTALRNSGAEAFRDCKALASVRLSENTKLSEAMFARSGLKSVEIFEKVDIPAFCFAQCASLKEVKICNSLISVGFGAFSECLELSSFVWGDGVTVNRLAEQAFYGSTALKQFTLPNCSIQLDNYCFLDCESLEEIVLGADTVFNAVYGSVFQGTALKRFNATVSNNYAFDAANGLLLNKTGDTVIFAVVGKDYSQSELVLNYANIGEGAFCGANVTAVTFACPVNVQSYAFANCAELASVTFAQGEGTTVGAHAFNSCEALVAINNLENVKAVGSYAFANTALTNGIVLGANSQFDEGAFYKSKVTSVTVGENSTFSTGAFQNCEFLEKVVMPQGGNVSFGMGCFANDVALSSIDLSTMKRIEREAFYGCSSLVTAVLTNATVIDDYAFADCGGLRHVEFPVVTHIGEGAFGRYSEKGGAPIFMEVELPETLTALGEGAFLGCEGLLEVTIPSKITRIPGYAFSFCLNLQRVVLPESVTSVGTFAFYGCEKLENINLNNVKRIGDYSFAKASLLQLINLDNVESVGEAAFAETWVSGNIVAEKLKTVGDYAFQNTYLTSFVADNLESIGIAAFQDNKNLAEFVLSNKISYVGSQAFWGCEKLAAIVAKDAAGQKLQSGKVNDYALLDDGVLYTVLPSGALQLAAVPAAKQAKTLTVLENTFRIDDFAGNANCNVENVVLPDTLRLIGNYAFYGYKNLKTVEFRSFTAPALEDSYTSAAELAETDPGYGKLHNSFGLGKWELCYYNFVDLVGKNEPIKMILPANDGVIGYDSLVYEVYFGKVEDSERSQYVARDKNLVLFFEYAQEVAQLKTITLTDATLINNAVSALNAITQDATDYGYSKGEWERLERVVREAKATLRLLQLANASQAAQQLQVEVNALPQQFDVVQLPWLQDVATKLSKLTPAERALLDLSSYNNLQSQMNAYTQSVVDEVSGVVDVVNNIYTQKIAVALASVAAAGLAVVVLKRRFW